MSFASPMSAGEGTSLAGASPANDESTGSRSALSHVFDEL